jgi:hypothetical protein
MEAEKTGPEPPARHLNGRMWSPGQSGNPHGRPVGARGRFSERFVADLTTAWEQYGETALAETAELYPDRFVAIAESSHSKRRISEPYSSIAGQSGRDRLADADRDLGRHQAVFA